jgi:hypothetical protein
MRKSKFAAEKINAILGEADRDGVVRVANRYGISRQTIYVWRKRFGQQSGRLRLPPINSSLNQQLGEPVATDLQHFCAAHYGAPAINIIREAVKLFIRDQLARDPEVKKRFDRLREELTEKSLATRESDPPSSTDGIRPTRRT